MYIFFYLKIYTIRFFFSKFVQQTLVAVLFKQRTKVAAFERLRHFVYIFTLVSSSASKNTSLRLQGFFS